MIHYIAVLRRLGGLNSLPKADNLGAEVIVHLDVAHRLLKGLLYVTINYNCKLLYGSKLLVADGRNSKFRNHLCISLVWVGHSHLVASDNHIRFNQIKPSIIFTWAIV